MTKLIGIKLNGNLHRGVEATLSIGFAGLSYYKEVTGKLPPFPLLQTTINQWQSNYRSLGSANRALKPFKINYAGSISDKYENCQNCETELRKQLNNWLRLESFRSIRENCLMELQQGELARMLIRTSHRQLRQIPWHLWDLLDNYPNIELAFSATDYQKPPRLKTPTYRDKVRILAILGNSSGIDVQKDHYLLNRLPDAEVEFLLQPERYEINDRLWEKSWDIIFFAGHSQTVGDSGRIYINDRESLTIDDLKYGLRKAIANGLTLAIFNSCDGLGLASELEALHIPQIIVMREQVPDQIAQVFLKHFLTAFANRGMSLSEATKEARLQLHGFENKYPCASWLPVICQNVATAPLTWLDLGRRSTSINPYRGLFAFREKDARLFFGRKSFTDMLVNAVNEKPLVAVIGASGSGKSSVVFAGLVKRLRDSGEWHIVDFRLGFQPLFNLATAVSQTQSHQDIRSLARDLVSFENKLRDVVDDKVKNHPNRRFLLVIDQFEELYTLCRNPDERQAFLDRLLEAIYRCHNFTVVITLRADFLVQALFYRPFADALQYADLKLGSMSPEELQAAVEKPAALLGVTMEKGLVERIVSDVIAEPGNLPLLQFALNQLWENLQNNQLTHAAYDDIGGVEKALADYADKVYNQLNSEQQKTAQRMFIQLVHPGEGTEDTRRVANRMEVGEENWDLVTRLADARLVVTARDEQTDSDTVEIVHEALISNWWRLQQWMELDRDFRRWQEHLRSAIDIWKSHGEDEKALLQGRRLKNAEYWQNNRFSELSLDERSFIGLSVEFRQRENRKEKQRRRFTILGLSLCLFVTFSLPVVFWFNSQNLLTLTALSASSESLLTANHQFNPLIAAIKTKQNLQHLPWVDPDIKNQASKNLEQAIYGVVEYNRFSKHSNSVWAVAFSPDGKTIASASADKTIKLWSRDGHLLHILSGHKNSVWSVAFSPNGKTIASASGDKTIKIWNLDGEELNTFSGHSDKVYSVAFSPDGRTIASAGANGNIKLWNLRGREITSFKAHNKEIRTVVFSPDGRTIASASKDKTIKLWSLDGKELKTFRGHSDKVYSVAFSFDGQKIASGSADNTVKIWSLDGQELNSLNGHTDRVWSVIFSPDGKKIASASWDNTVNLWSSNGKFLRTLQGHKDRVRGVAFSPDSKTIASASEDKTVKLWKLDNGLSHTLKGHKQAVIGLGFSPDGKIIASASDDKTIKLWNRDGDRLETLEGHTSGVLGVDFSPDGKIIASASDDKTIKLWNRDGDRLKTLEEHTDGVWDVKFSPDGKKIVSASMDDTIKLWHGDGKFIKTLGKHQDEVREAIFSFNGKFIASASVDKTVKIWKPDGTLLHNLPHQEPVLAISFSPDSQILASATSGDRIKLWQTQSGKLIEDFPANSKNVIGISFSPDGEIIASAGGDNTVKLWQPDGTLLATLRGHTKQLRKVTFSPDGETIASASEDKTVMLWNKSAVLTNPLELGCSWMRDYLKNNHQHKDLKETYNFCETVRINHKK